MTAAAFYGSLTFADSLSIPQLAKTTAHRLLKGTGAFQPCCRTAWLRASRQLRRRTAFGLPGSIVAAGLSERTPRTAMPNCDRFEYVWVGQPQGLADIFEAGARSDHHPDPRQRRPR